MDALRVTSGAKRCALFLCCLCFFCLLFFFRSPLLAADAPVSNADYAALLKQHVHQGRVDYAGLKKNEIALDQVLAQFALVNPAALSRDEQFAFYVNLYNAWTLKLVLSKYPGLKSIKDAGSLVRSPWKLPLVKLQTETLSLDEIEHERLRPVFKDARVHMAVNCASKSCPILRDEPYDGRRLSAQLDEAARGFVNSPEGVAVQTGRLLVNKIFSWYAADFGGEPGVMDFIRRYASLELETAIAALGPRPRLAYMDYDWRLNGE